MALSGHLDLVCGLDSRGLSSLRRQSFRAPMHLSKPCLEERTLVVNVVNPTAGLLSGDRIDCRACVEPGARLVLTTPSASRVYRTPRGGAELTQEFDVAAGGFLEVWPELFIPQAGASYRQKTILRVAAGGELVFFETLAPGRVAAGEVFAYTALDWETDLFVAGQLAARERYRLVPGEAAVEALRARFPTAYYASCFAISPRLVGAADCWAGIHALHEAEAWVGCSRLSAGGWVVKVVASGSILLRRKLAQIRGQLYAALGEIEPNLRRTAPVG